MGSNIVYNDTDTREMWFTVNGRDGSSSMRITGHRCVEFCELDEVIDDGEVIVGLWSDPATWVNLDNRIPIEGEEVLI